MRCKTNEKYHVLQSSEFNEYNHEEMLLKYWVANTCCLSIGAYANRHVFRRATLVS